jgi:hypothetical protein
MLAFRRMLLLAVVCLGNLVVGQNQWQQGDENAAARVLGPRWQQLSRDSGMIFSGTVLAIRSLHSGDQKEVPAVEVTFHVDRAIAGVRPGQVLTIREWAGAWPLHPLRKGQRVLLFLYPRSRLGLTSPVGGTLGQVELSGKNFVVAPTFVPARDNDPQLQHPLEPESRIEVSLSQLEQAIRRARAFRSPRTWRGRVAAEER